MVAPVDIDGISTICLAAMTQYQSVIETDRQADRQIYDRIPVLLFLGV